AWGRGDAASLRASLAAHLPDADVHVWPDVPPVADYAIVWRPPREFFARTRITRAVFNYGAGVDGLVDLGELPPGLPVYRLHDAGMAEQMIDYVEAAVLRAWRHLDVYALQQRDAQWRRAPPGERGGFGIGIYGMGVMGRAVANALVSRGFAVRGFARTAQSHVGVTMYSGDAGLAPFLAGARVLVCLVPLTAATRDSIDATFLAQLPVGAHVVNAARGEIIVDAALLAALDAGHIASATLDVFREEPLPAAHPFWHHPRISVTPHVAAATLMEPAVTQIAERIAALERGIAVEGAVDISRGY
ncbi:MAG: glyoxylate/hydroxypyruvate reductase A, partial [Casimicrobiaceae bacterium]